MSTVPDSTATLAVFNLAHDHRPDRVVAPSSSAEVVAAVRGSERIHVVATGHGLIAPIEGGTALSTRLLRGVAVDPVQRVARVGAGVTWAEVIEAAAPHGLAPVCGSAPGVGVVGYLLGGGISPIGRTFGWGSDHLRSIELVTAAGEVVIASADDHAELFWALRGGKHAPGVVVSVEVALVPVSTLYAGGLYFAGEDAETVLTTFALWSADLPESVTTSCALLRLPDVDQVPEPLRGRFVVHVRVAAVAEADEAESLVAPMRTAATPIVDTVTEMPFAAIGSVHADPEGPLPAIEGGALLRDFDADAARALLSVAGPGVDAPFAVIEIRRLGGALARPAADAVSGRDAAYGLLVVGAPVPELFETVVPAATRETVMAMAPWASGGFQPNFIGSLNAPWAWDRAWPDEVRARLAAVYRDYDPAGVFGR